MHITVGRKSKGGDEEDEVSRPEVLVVEDDMPAGARGDSSGDESKKHTEIDAAHKLLNIDLSA